MMNKNACLVVATGLLLVLGMQPVSADIIAYESFSSGTPGGDLLGQPTGTGFEGTWGPGGFNASIHDNYDIAAGSLSFGNLATSGNSVTTQVTQSIAGVTSSLTQPIGSNTTFYMSMLVRPEGTVGEGAFGGFFGLYLDSTNGNGNDLFIGKGGTGNQYLMETRGGTGQSLTNYVAESGETRMLVVKAELGAGLDTFTMWVDRPLGGGDPSSFDAIKNDLDIAGISGIALYSTGAFTIDEIRFGESYADVTDMMTVPEPAMVPALAVVAATLWYRRRRSKQSA